MATRQIVQGFINRAAVSMRVISDPAYNIGADQLDESMITYAPQGNASDMLPTATGIVPSPIPYMPINITFRLVKTSAVCQRYLDRLKSRAFFGDIELTTDASALDKITVQNVTILSQDSTAFSGKDPAIGFTLVGYVPINNDLFG